MTKLELDYLADNFGKVRLNWYSDKINELSIREINYIFRKNDESRLWPICGRFNATERAIRRIRRYRRMGMEVKPGYEYLLTLDDEISKIVNDPRL